MTPTGTQIFAKVRESFGDSEVSGGQIWTDTKLLPYLSLAHQFLLGELASVQSELLRRDVFFLLDAYQSTIPFSLLPVTSMEEVSGLWVRKPTLTATATAVSLSGDEVTVTVASTSGWSDGDVADGMDFGGIPDLNGEWVVEVLNGTTLKLRGLETTGTWTSGGKLVKGPEWGEPLTKTINTQNWPNTSLSAPVRWCRQKSGLRLTPASQQTELKLSLVLSGSEFSSASESVGLDGTQLFFVSWITAFIASPKGRPELTVHHNLIWREQLDRLKRESAKDLQLSQRYRTPAFRGRRRFHIAF